MSGKCGRCLIWVWMNSRRMIDGEEERVGVGIEEDLWDVVVVQSRRRVGSGQ